MGWGPLHSNLSIPTLPPAFQEREPRAPQECCSGEAKPMKPQGTDPPTSRRKWLWGSLRAALPCSGMLFQSQMQNYG